MTNYGAWSGFGQALGGGIDAFQRAKQAKAQALATAGQADLDKRMKEAQIAKLGAEADKLKPRTPGAGPVPVDAETAFKYENALRDEYANKSKDFAAQTAALGRIEQSAKTPSAAGDLALIFNYMKMLDPGSTVREGEFANAQNAAGVPDQIKNAWNRVQSGERLNPAQRRDFYQSARRTYAGALGTQKQVRGGYQKLAGQYGVKPENILLDPADPRWYEEGGFNPEDVSGLGLDMQEAPPVQAPAFDPAAEAARIAARRKAVQPTPQQLPGMR